MKSGFLEKLVARLDRVVPGDVQQIVTRLIRERGFLEKVFEALHEGVIITDPQGVIGFLNRAACQFFGLDAERATGARISSQIRGLDWANLARPGRTISRDLEVFYPENRYLNFYLAPIDDAEEPGEPLGYVMLVRDLTTTRAEASLVFTPDLSGGAVDQFLSDPDGSICGSSTSGMPSWSRSADSISAIRR